MHIVSLLGDTVYSISLLLLLLWEVVAVVVFVVHIFWPAHPSCACAILLKITQFTKFMFNKTHLQQM